MPTGDRKSQASLARALGVPASTASLSKLSGSTFCWVLGFGFRVEGLGFRVWNPEPKKRCKGHHWAAMWLGPKGSRV